MPVSHVQVRALFQPSTGRLVISLLLYLVFLPSFYAAFAELDWLLWQNALNDSVRLCLILIAGVQFLFLPEITWNLCDVRGR